MSSRMPRLRKYLHTVGHAVGCVSQRVLEVSGSPFVHYILDSRSTLGLLFFRGQLSLVYLDVILGSQPPQGFGIGHLLMFHDEAHGCAALAAREALADVARGRHIERGRSVVVERTQPLVVHSALAKRDELRYHVDNVGGIQYSVYGLAVYHILLIRFGGRGETVGDFFSLTPNHITSHPSFYPNKLVGLQRKSPLRVSLYVAYGSFHDAFVALGVARVAWLQIVVAGFNAVRVEVQVAGNLLVFLLEHHFQLVAAAHHGGSLGRHRAPVDVGGQWQCAVGLYSHGEAVTVEQVYGMSRLPEAEVLRP